MSLDTKHIRQLAALAPGCTLNIIKDGVVEQKLRLSMPPRLYNLDFLSCKNTSCISHSMHKENIPASFQRQEDTCFSCKYCGVHHKYDDVRDV